MTHPDDTLTVLVDNRAGSRELVQFPPLSTVGRLCRLPSADVLIHGNGPTGPALVGVEVKSLSDALSSMSTGRLQRQARQIVADYDYPWLLLYGEYRPAIKGGALQIRGRGGRWAGYRLGGPSSTREPVPYAYLEAMLLTVQALGVRVKQLAEPREAAVWLGVLAAWWAKDWAAHRGLRTFDTSGDAALAVDMDPRMALRARVAGCLPGIGFERGVALAGAFGSVREMIGASAEELAEVVTVSKTGRRVRVGKVHGRAIEEAVS